MCPSCLGPCLDLQPQVAQRRWALPQKGLARACPPPVVPFPRPSPSLPKFLRVIFMRLPDIRTTTSCRSPEPLLVIPSFDGELLLGAASLLQWKGPGPRRRRRRPVVGIRGVCASVGGVRVGVVRVVDGVRRFAQGCRARRPRVVSAARCWTAAHPPVAASPVLWT
eukprot:350505-Chlamydomonas_euryale.AAC.5